MKWPFINSVENPPESRSLAVSDLYATRLPLPHFTTWTVENAVRNGYRVSGWVYLAVTKIMSAGSTVPFVVCRYDDDKIDWQHPITRLLQKPNPVWSRANMSKLIIAWLQLAGNGYWHRVMSGRKTIQLWPITPDRLSPVPSSDAEQLVSGYKSPNGEKFKMRQGMVEALLPEEVIHVKLIDPEKPYTGIAPLEAAGRAVDTSNEIRAFNKAAAENRGVMDGLLMLENATPQQARTIREHLLEVLTRTVDKMNARLPGIIGSKGTYHRTGETPAELDFPQASKDLRDEILNIFGVPLALVSGENMTLDNMKMAEPTFWRSTLVPLLLDIADDIDFSLRQGVDELGDNHYIGIDTSKVAALKVDQESQAAIARQYWDMGVPVQTINDYLQLGLPEFKGWDTPWTGKEIQAAPGQRARRYQLIEVRNFRQEELESEKVTNGAGLKLWREILDQQQTVAFSALERGASVDSALATLRSALIPQLDNAYRQMGMHFAADIVVENRAMGDEPTVEELLISRLARDALAFKFLAETDADTTNLIAAQVVDLVDSGASIGQIQQAVIDAGVFDEARALMLSRTMVVQAQSVGQMSAAEAAGATKKTWRTSGFSVRPTHSAAEGQTVNFDAYYNIGGERAEYPGDSRLSIKNRANCRCSQTFSLEE